MNLIDGSESLYSVLNNLTDGVIIADSEGNFLLFNLAAENILGIGSQNVESVNWSSAYGCFRIDKVTPYSSDQLPLSRALKGVEVVNEMLFIRNTKRADGVWVSISASPIRSTYGLITSGIVIIRDVTEYQNTLEKLIRFVSAIDQTADSVVITNVNGVIEYVNTAFESTTGYSYNEVVGQTPSILKSGKHDNEFYVNLWATITGGNPYRGTIINRKKNNELYWADQTISPIKDDRGNIISFVSVLKDITELRKHHEREVQLKWAHQIQQLINASSISVPGLDIAGATFPAVEMCGDYFDFIPMADGCFAIVVADVIGHGIGAALILAETRAYLRAFAKLTLSPAEICTRLNAELITDLKSEYFVTLIIARINPREGSIVYANAGHPPAYLLNRTGGIDYLLESTAPPLGFLDNYQIYDSDPLKLNQNSIAVFITDGVNETMSEDRLEFGFQRALEVVNVNRHVPAQRIIEYLYNELKIYSNNRVQEDDITAVICKVNADCIIPL